MDLLFGLLKMVAVVGGAGLALYIGATLMNEHKQPAKKAQPVAAPAAPAFTAPPVAQPLSGTVRWFAPGVPIAPLEIKTSGTGNFLVKLEDAYRGIDVMDIFVRGGGTVQVEVPLGRYVLKYASGTTWYGYDYLFGPDTAYNKAEAQFDFRDEGYQVTGYTVTLSQVRNGNMRTRRLSPAEF